MKKANKCRVCIDYIDLNKSCPRDPFLLPNVSKLVDQFCSFHVLSFMDAYFYFNNITMYRLDEEKITLIIEETIFCYKMMHFGLKNVGELIRE